MAALQDLLSLLRTHRLEVIDGLLAIVMGEVAGGEVVLVLNVTPLLAPRPAPHLERPVSMTKQLALALALALT